MLKKIFFTILVLYLIASVIFFIYERKKPRYEYEVRDTNTLIKYEKQVKNDTIVKYTDRILYLNKKPDAVYYTKTDTVFIKNAVNYELPLRVEKFNDELKIHSINFRDSIFREYNYKNINGDFTLLSIPGNISVKTNNFSFISPKLGINYMYNFKERKPFINLNIEAGMNIMGKVDMNAIADYNINTQTFYAGGNLKIKLF